MKKFNICGLLLALIIFFSGTVTAFEGDPTNGQGLFKLAIGGYDRKIDLDITKVIINGKTLSSSWTNNTDYNFQQSGTLMEASYGIINELDILIGIGFSNDEFKETRSWRRDSTATYHNDQSHIIKVGLKTQIPLKYGLSISGDAIFSIWKSDASGSRPYYWREATNHKLEYSELSISTYIMKQFSKFSTYGGITYTALDIIQTYYIYEFVYEQEDHLGIIAGISYSFTNDIDFNLTGKFINQQSLGANLSYKF